MTTRIPIMMRIIVAGLKKLTIFEGVTFCMKGLLESILTYLLGDDKSSRKKDDLSVAGCLIPETVLDNGGVNHAG
jgi:hypothetical protein